MTGVDKDLATLRDLVMNRTLARVADYPGALARVEAELSRLRALLHGPDRVGQLWKRVEAAEARCARLQQALLLYTGYTESVKNDPDYDMDGIEWEHIYEQAREALAGQPTAAEGPDTPADICPECGSGILDGEHIANYPCSRRDTPADSPRGIRPVIAPWPKKPAWDAAADSTRIECDGSPYCMASPHMHGCFADKGDCDHPAVPADSQEDKT